MGNKAGLSGKTRGGELIKTLMPSNISETKHFWKRNERNKRNETTNGVGSFEWAQGKRRASIWFRAYTTYRTYPLSLAAKMHRSFTMPAPIHTATLLGLRDIGNAPP